ncbi:hypothetical protein [Paraliomyxa miuraensis]|uniref:hypothetical protein n=1 Tax=Paraliomyxa miuraensis TaxID=376150 RepID=UPI00224FC5FC|nr:hypothetical protein [Paraliomyxa miuraensis]MCX4247580.1 hypothetical protein [Paraliomyxa miuraensis]
MLARFALSLPLLTAPACTSDEPPQTADDASTTATTGTTGTTTPPITTTSSDATGADASTAEPGSSTSGGSSSSSASAETGTASDSTDTTASDSTGEAPALGTISGECGLIDALELDSPSAFTFENAIDFRDLGFDYDLLTPEGQAVYDAGNLGGSSLHSEVISFEVLARCEGAQLLATEGEIVYTDPMGTKTDVLVEIDGRVVGVSVTRAVGFPPDDPYTEMQAANLLTDKLEDILASTANVAPRDAWVKQILHVIAYADMHAQSLLAAYATLPPEVTADTILLVTVTHGNDAFVY